MSETQAVATVKIDNAQVRVTEWRFAPGAHTGHHRHEYAYVVVPLVTGALAARDAGVEHDVRNPNPFEFAFIEIELKGAPGA